MSGFLNNGVKHLLHVYRFRFHVFYSTAAAATSQTEFLVETLVNSLGFSQREALSTSAKEHRKINTSESSTKEDKNTRKKHKSTKYPNRATDQASRGL
uniref:Uncharacterized protein isoform X2 n=1 Tax=Nicotiana tabacum TaxID=4097 RepID=A0A1S3Z3C8_TOBAC|nr:uncharacterized protein LOC104121456 isoform X3 [Nicotiana tomentosiformis]XP_016458940.1 PREDICTED: uncharacterized protein LOC107782570 isoform X2 [Nicotiana tabacum]